MAANQQTPPPKAAIPLPAGGAKAVPVRRWMEDSETNNCLVCRKSFGLLTRKHHCRSCGRIVCASCSDKRWSQPSATAGAAAEKVRVCTECYDSLMTKQNDMLLSGATGAVRTSFASPASTASAAGVGRSPATSVSSPVPAATNIASAASPAAATAAASTAVVASPASDHLIYNTQTLCARCSFVDRKGFTLKPAQLWERRAANTATGHIVLVGSCPTHGITQTLVCRNGEFYQRMLSFTNDHHKFLTLKRDPSAARPKSKPVRVGSLTSSNASPVATMAAAGTSPLPPLAIGGSSASSGSAGVKPQLADIEDLDAALKLGPQSKTLPMVVDLTIYRGDAFIPDAEVDRQLNAFNLLYPKAHQFVLKLKCGLVQKNEIVTLNTKLLRIAALPFMKHRNNPILVDLAVERLYDLTSLSNTCLLNGRMYPAVAYCISSSPDADSTACVNELKDLLERIGRIQDIQLVLLLSVDRPYPDLTPLMEYIFTQKGLIRFVMISRERSPADLLDRLTPATAASASASASGDQKDAKGGDAPAITLPPLPADINTGYVESTDPYELLECLDRSTGGRIRPSDFVPVRAGTLLEPFFRLLGYGNFAIRPNPFCGFATLLISTHTAAGTATDAKAAPATATAAGAAPASGVGLQSMPVTRLFDLKKLYEILLPLALKLETDTFGLSTAKQIQKALESCSISRVPVPDLFGYLSSSDAGKQKIVTSFVRHAQFIVVHNTMDFHALDMVRRCECAVVGTSSVAKFGVAAACTGCL